MFRFASAATAFRSMRQTAGLEHRPAPATDELAEDAPAHLAVDMQSRCKPSPRPDLAEGNFTPTNGGQVVRKKNGRRQKRRPLGCFAENSGYAPFWQTLRLVPWNVARLFRLVPAGAPK